jgi:3-hydroxyisobutyrate dehydrogenase-like beta-hydroxyacid dehydrogenase
MQTIGFIGLGLMGSRMVARLLDAGHRLLVYNRTVDKARTLLDAGAEWAASPCEAARGADVVWTMLSTPEVVERVATGDNGFLPAMKESTLWIDSSTVDPACSRRMAAAAGARGVRFLDAPVSGSTSAAEAGDLLFLVGGARVDVDQARPLFEEVARKVLHVGGSGQGAALKLVFNQLLGTAILAAAEAIVLGESQGIDRPTLFAALEDCGALPSGLRERIRASIEEAVHEPGFPLQWIEKDLRLASRAGAERGAVIPMTDAAKTTYALARRHGWGARSITAVFEYLRGTQRPTSCEETGRRE